MEKLNEFLKVAQDVFGISNENGRGDRNPFYIEVPCFLSKERLANSKYDSQNFKPALTNPLIFLTGIRESTATPYTGQYTAAAPSISLVVGQYGFGKTELLHQLHHYVLNSRYNFSILSPLPINLASCREQLEILNQVPNKESFTKLLFNHLLEKFHYSKQFVNNELIPQIIRGNVLLILDGLDELAGNSSQHKNFFTGLMRLLKDEENAFTKPEFKVTVSTRLEYLMAVDNVEASDLVETIKREGSIQNLTSVYFLTLELFDDSRIQDYLGNVIITREKSKEKLFNQLQKNTHLLDILRRPLLLKIFCELANEVAPNQQFNDWLEIKHVGELFDEYIKQASQKMSQDRTQRILSSFKWNIDKLALKSLDLYKEGRENIEIEDIYDFLDANEHNTYPSTEHNLDWKARAFESIHKLPFLRRTLEIEPEGPMKGKAREYVRFAHRAFQEFFTAKGMALELEAKSDENFISFDKLVLNVDMRKFLKYIIGEEKWYARTKRSYGLENTNEWNCIQSVDFEKLNRNRKILLDSMTDPENPPEEIENTIEWFIHVQKTQELHPYYLMYNYEAVAVYLRHNWWKMEVRNITEHFSKLLQSSLKSNLEQLHQKDVKLREPLELLVERIIDIAQRLRFEWVQEYSKGDQQLVENIQEEATRKRIEVTLEHIKGAVF